MDPKPDPVELDKVPGLPEAVARARAAHDRLRELAYLDVPVEIGGIEVEQYRPRHELLLCAAGNPFVCGGGVGAEHVAQFLWVVTGQHRAAELTKEEFAASLPDVPDEAIDAYRDTAMLDAPRGRGSRREPIVGFWASLEHEFAKAYGYPVERTFDIPFARLWQLWRLIVRDENPQAEFANRLVLLAERQALAAYDAAQASDNPQSAIPNPQSA